MGSDVKKKRKKLKKELREINDYIKLYGQSYGNGIMISGNLYRNLQEQYPEAFPIWLEENSSTQKHIGVSLNDIKNI